MNSVLGVGFACVVIAAPTLLYLGVRRKLSDNLPSIGPSGETDSGGYAPRPETVDCGTCGASNMLGARYCGECLDELRF